MQRIEIVRLRIERFRSFQAETIEFSDRVGLKFLTGANEVESQLGANGAGKSSIWDALCFCLYGSSVQGERASTLGADRGKKKPRVTATLRIDDELVDIIREGSPERIFVGEEPATQADIDRLVGLNRIRFLHSVLYGQAVPLFLDLSLPQRAELLDAIFDHEIWMRLSDKAGQDLARFQLAVTQNREATAREEGRLREVADVASLQASAAAWTEDFNKDIDRMVDIVEAAEHTKKVKLREAQVARAKLAEHPEPRELQRRIANLQRDKAAQEAIYRDHFRAHQVEEERAVFFRRHQHCSTCQQRISRDFARQQVDSAEKLCAELKDLMQRSGAITNGISQLLEEEEAEARTVSRKREHFLQLVATAEAEEASAARAHTISLDALERKGAEPNPFDAQLAARQGDAEALENSVRKMKGERRQLEAKAMRAEFWKGGFKRIRLLLIARALGQMEVETENAASTLGLTGWRIKFTTETETKSGTVRQGVQVQVFAPGETTPWSAWSGGEAQRIRIAISAGISAMIQQMAGVIITTEIWDEPTSWLSPEGIDDLLDCFRWRAQSTGKSIWLSDHRSLQAASFAEVWQVTKGIDGSKVRQLASMAEQ